LACIENVKERETERERERERERKRERERERGRGYSSSRKRQNEQYGRTPSYVAAAADAADGEGCLSDRRWPGKKNIEKGRF
jgi:hypothetical protein